MLRWSKQSILKEINSESLLEGLMLKPKFQYFGQLMVKSWLIGKDPDAGKDWGQETKGVTEDEMVGWHQRLDGHEFEQAVGDGEGQGNLGCCSPWGCKESHDWVTEQHKMLRTSLFFIYNNTFWEWPLCWSPDVARAMDQISNIFLGIFVLLVLAVKFLESRYLICSGWP